jgi:hypothetical protein
MFALQQAVPIPVDRIPNETLGELLHYWSQQRDDRPMPRRDDIDPTAIRRNVGRMHLLAVEGPGVYRYRIYGSAVTNPDMLEMTGKTTRDYRDQSFARLVTSHMDEALAQAVPTCYQIEALTDGKPYRYIRMILPLGDATGISHLLVGTQRLEVDGSLHRQVLSALSA